MNARCTTGLWDPCCAPSPYASRVFDLPASTAVWALTLGYAIAKDVSGDARWVVDAGRARLDLKRLIHTAAPLNRMGPLLRLEGRLVRRWVQIPVEVELSAWSGHQCEVAVRSSQWPTCPRWYFPAALAALGTLRAKITAWASAAGHLHDPRRSPMRRDEESGRGR
jgi:hypothetical protein